MTEVSFKAREAGSDWLYAEDDRAHAVRHPDAFEPGRDDRGASAWTGGNQVLDTQEVLGDDGTEAKSQSDTGSDRAEGEHPPAGELTAVDGLLAAAGRCVGIGDRESDIYELFCLAEEAGTHFLVRACVDRLAGDGNQTVSDEMDNVAVKAYIGLRSSASRIHFRELRIPKIEWKLLTDLPVQSQGRHREDRVVRVEVEDRSPSRRSSNQAAR
ncbi:hypothetical protein IVB16_31415 [Bradyrhizobium sp. 183]|uniref:hypothetical protein n=1 Tax=unclassified Bradyrhizobium TaxID=2631580 RepID=UPI001FFFF409|nr:MULTISPECIES: hypothetical protein [unclassified Bradyrhizobium]UPJ79256.1 hypothetical protein IVB17_31415 [Bradyrhizobium sp. 184]UPJ87049.1 hypothetical protein IVB16_31415 [Bradyrhizobium sp. 183]